MGTFFNSKHTFFHLDEIFTSRPPCTLIQCNINTGTFPFQVLVVITDGKQTTSKVYTKLSVASQGVKEKDVTVYAIGVGKGADKAELREIASSQDNVFVSASFEELQTLAVEIRKRLCEGLFSK